MNWINWVHFGVGIGLGIIIQRVMGRSENVIDSTLAKSEDNSHKSGLLQQMKQTQMAYQMAKEMSQFKSGFLARTTHVLRSPLNGLIGLHQLILSDLCDSPEEEREFISQAHERALKLLKLIDEILIIARIEHGTNQLNLNSVHLTEVLENVHQIIYMLAENRNYPLQVILPDEDICVLADAYWLRQVLVNLLDTAILNMEEGSIQISSQSDANNHLVYIWLDVPQAAIPGSEPIDCLQSVPQDIPNQQQEITVSPGMRLLMSQTILEVMGGKLEIVPYPIVEKAEEFTRLQISIPQGFLVAEFPQHSESLN